MPELRFRAMGSDAHLIVTGGPAGLLEGAQARLAELERRWSRFIETSEVTELTRRAGAWVTVSDDTHLLVRRAVEAWWLTGGAFDPTVLGDVLRAGYDRSFDDLRPDTSPARSVLLPGCDGIEFGPSTVRLASGTGFDPGGIGKGLAADLTVEALLEGGTDGACVNLGGDVRVAGASLDGRGWTIGVADPWGGDDLSRLGLADGAVATSSVLRRRWQRGGEERHHLIDPRTGRPSESPLVQVTVVAGTGWEAEVLAKAVLINGDAHPFDILGGTGAEALAVAEDGTVLVTPGLGAFGVDTVASVSGAGARSGLHAAVEPEPVSA
ncbi:MAG TPA: FAD:protein FMN transferase [Acidimicrobiia bacterium]|nr:FAD:protein FMN transferase [Acidimicrobiia bacterium]